MKLNIPTPITSISFSKLDLAERVETSPLVIKDETQISQVVSFLQQDMEEIPLEEDLRAPRYMVSVNLNGCKPARLEVVYDTIRWGDACYWPTSENRSMELWNLFEDIGRHVQKRKIVKTTGAHFVRREAMDAGVDDR